MTPGPAPQYLSVTSQRDPVNPYFNTVRVQFILYHIPFTSIFLSIFRHLDQVGCPYTRFASMGRARFHVGYWSMHDEHLSR